MVKKTMPLFLSSILLLANIAIFASGAVSLAYTKSETVIDAKNSVCPVTNAKITTREYCATYGGKRYWFNSRKAVVEFKKNPTKYIKNLEAAPKEATASIKKTVTVPAKKTSSR